MHHNRQSSRHQFRPFYQIPLPLPRNIDSKPQLQYPSHHPPGTDLASPCHRRRPERQGERVRVVWIREGEVRVYVFIGDVVENEDFAEESEHGDVFGDAADEDVAGGKLLVGGVRLAVEVEDDEGGVNGAGDGERGEDDEGGGGEELEDGELGGGA